MQKRYYWLLIVLILNGLVGCGQSGKLYLPKNESGEVTNAAKEPALSNRQ